jgi:NAD(P)-dependent dehydrogenase (short-subunit alcohol dehydrogenase family)
MGTPLRTLFDLTGRHALVTGGSRGLGLQMAEALGEAGASLLITARKEAELDAAARRLRERGIDVEWRAADASDPQAIAALGDWALGRRGHLDILVNNAGAAWGAPAEEHPLEAWDKVHDLNVRAVFLLCQWIARRTMIPRRSGRIIMTASVAGLGGNPRGHETVAYNTSKAAVIGLTRTLAAEWGEFGINVNAIAPGWFASRMTRATFEKFGVEHLAESAPLGRLGDEDDLKGAVVLFASEAGKHITGQVLAIDGGASAVVGG